MKEKFQEAILYGVGSAIGSTIVTLILYHFIKQNQEIQTLEIQKLKEEIQYHY